MEMLAGTTWTVTSIDGAPTASGEGDRKAEVVFVDEARVSITGGCNRMVGPYTQHSGDRISFGGDDGPQFASTRMACVGPAGEQDAALSKAILDASQLLKSGDVLTLLDNSGNARVVMRKAG